MVEPANDTVAKRERQDYAVLIAIMMREEAEVMAGALRADGIDAFIGNSNHAYAEWLLIPAMNGLQVLVPRAKLAEAKALVRERIKENAAAPLEEDDGEPVKRHDRWKMLIGIVVLLSPWLAYMGLGASYQLGEWLYNISGGVPG